jgi:hypothetical protein
MLFSVAVAVEVIFRLVSCCISYFEVCFSSLYFCFLCSFVYWICVIDLIGS